MRSWSGPLALLLALLVVLWQPLCLCHAEGVEGGHSLGERAHAAEHSGHHDASHASASDHHENGDLNGQGEGGPCDDHGSGCDCFELVASIQKSAESGKAGLEGLEAALAAAPVTFVEPPPLRNQGLRELAPGCLPPPPLLKLQRVLLI